MDAQVSRNLLKGKGKDHPVTGYQNLEGGLEV